MSKNLLFVTLALVMFGFGFFYISRPKSTPVPAVVSSSPSPAASFSTYLPYTSQVLADSVSLRRVLFFYASWCPTCRPTDAQFSASSNQIPEGVVVIRINYNDPDTDSEEKALAAKYGVTYQHTFIQIDGSGEVVNKWNGGGLKELLANLKP